MPQDRVRTINQERLDRPDFDALQTLVYEAQSLLLGGLLGASSGLLSPLKYALSDDGVTYKMTFDRFMAVHTTTDATRVEDHGFSGSANVGAQWSGVMVAFNPADTGHLNHPLDYTAARAQELATPGTRPYIWVRPIDVPADVDTRRFYDVATGAEVPVPTSTRTRQRMEFSMASTAPAAGAGAAWAAIARVDAWAAGTVVAGLLMLSCWDDNNAGVTLGDAPLGDPESYTADNASFAHPLQRLVEGSDLRGDGGSGTWPDGPERSAGLAYHFQWIRSRIQRLISGGTSDDAATIIRPWWKPPEISLNGAKVVLDAHETQLASHAGLITEAAYGAQRQTIRCSGVLVFHPAGMFPAPNDTDGWSLAHGWGFEKVTMGAINAIVSVQIKPSLIVGKEGWYISSVHTSKVNQVGTTLHQLVPTMLPDPLVDPALFAGGGTVDDYKGAAVGLAAGEHGVQIVVVPNGTMTSMLAFAVSVVISKFRGSDVGV